MTAQDLSDIIFNHQPLCEAVSDSECNFQDEQVIESAKSLSNIFKEIGFDITHQDIIEEFQERI